jgi:hypothetical protein
VPSASAGVVHVAATPELTSAPLPEAALVVGVGEEPTQTSKLAPTRPPSGSVTVADSAGVELEV